MKLGPVLFLLAAALAPGAHAQRDVSLGAGVGTVRFTGGSQFSAANLSPSAQIYSPTLFFGAAASLSSLEDGVVAAQGRVDLWTLFPRRPLAVSAGVAASTRSDGLGSAVGHAIGEIIATRDRGGAAVGAGIVGGGVDGSPGISALRLRARAWHQLLAAQLSLTIEPTRFLGAWYTDITAGATLDRGPVIASLWAIARASGAYGSKGTASASLQYFVTSRLAVEGAAGGYLADPFQGFPRGGYVSLGVRLHTARRPMAPPAAPALGPLIAARRGDSVVVRFRMVGAGSVAIAGDWTTWQPLPLRGLGDDIWEGAFVLAAGTYHFSLHVDGEWVVPGGVAVVPDGLGGLVAVLVVL